MCLIRISDAQKFYPTTTKIYSNMQVWKIFCLLLFTAGCSTPPIISDNALTLTVTNKSSLARTDALIRINAVELAQRTGVSNWARVKFTAEEELIPFDPVDEDRDGQVDGIDLLLNIGAGKSKRIAVDKLAEGEAPPVFPKRTQAEISHKTGGYWKGREYQEGNFQNVDLLRVPPEHTDHSWFIRYEGPGWESDLVGYRFYLDWRNATDVFGKKTSAMVLQKVGQDGFDSYHEPSDWGLDVLKVGSSLGVGSLGTWAGDQAQRVAETDSLSCQILKNGLLESTVRTNYYGWAVGDRKTDLQVDLSIHAGSRLTRSEVSMSEPFDNLCTGIVKLKQGEVLRGESGQWAYLATWGEQSLATDDLGLAVIYRKKDLRQVTEDKYSHVVVLNPEGKSLSYYFLAAWEQEKNGITTREEFLTYLDTVLEELNSPLTVNI